MSIINFVLDLDVDQNTGKDLLIIKEENLRDKSFSNVVNITSISPIIELEMGDNGGGYETRKDREGK